MFSLLNFSNQVFTVYRTRRPGDAPRGSWRYPLGVSTLFFYLGGSYGLGEVFGAIPGWKSTGRFALSFASFTIFRTSASSLRAS